MDFLHNFNPQPIIFTLGPLTVRWYGLLIALALLACILIAVRLGEKRNLPANQIYDLTFWLAVGGIAGARLYDVFFIAWDYYGRNPLDILKIWQGGLAIHGAVLGGLITLLIALRAKKISLWPTLDIAAVVLPLGQAIGRWGNYFNQELFGRPTSLPWGIPIDNANRPLKYLDQQYFHPTFLYESLLNFSLFLVLFLLFKKKTRPGVLPCLYFIGYGIIRIITEFIRIDETTLIFGIRLPQAVSAAVIIIALMLLIFFTKKPMSKDEQKYEENPFENEVVAKQWINSVENEHGMFRDQNIYPKLNSWINKHQPRTIVDIGAGQGVCSEKIDLTDKEYHGIEPSCYLVERAKQLYPQPNRYFIVGNAYALPYENNFTDGAFSVNVWFHLENTVPAAGEMERILKQNGRFLIITANPDAYDIWESFYSNYEKTGKKITGQAEVPINPMTKNTFYFHTESELKQSLTSNGLIIDEISTMSNLKGKDLFIAIEGHKT